MTTYPPVSVALATFNGARHLRVQLESILAQSHPVAEIVLADDGSRDGTVELARAVVAEAAVTGSAVRLELVSGGPAGGVAANFGRALAATRHPIIALSDQDDRWHPDRIALGIEALVAKPNVLLLHANARLVDDDGTDLGTLFDAIEVTPAMRAGIRRGEGFDLLVRRNLVTGATVMLRRALLDLAGPTPPDWIHDEWLAIVAAAVDGLDVLDRPVLDYRQHGANEIGARRLSIPGKLRRMLEPGSERNRRLVNRARNLVERFEAMPAGTIPARRLAAARRKLEHESARSALSVHRGARIVPVLRELRTGRYAEFGRGFADAARDLCQPLTVREG